MQRHSRLLIEELAKRNDLDLVVIHPHEEKIFTMFSGVHEFSVKPINPKKIYLHECYLYSKRVYSIINQFPNHVIYAQGLSVWYHVNKIKKRLIVNPHGLEPFQAISIKEKLISIPFKLIFDFLFNHAAYVVSLGGGLSAILQNRISNKNTKVAVLPNGVKTNYIIELKKFHPEKLNLLFVARFAHNKGIHILMNAIKDLNAEGWQEKLEFNLGGRGPLLEYYKTHFNFPNTNFLGFISDEQLIDLYLNSDIFVLPTLFEGMPTVVLEAMSYRLPIIVSDVGATAELVNSSNGYLINKNNIFELKKAITDFYNLSISSKEKLSEASFNKVKEKYDWKTVAQNHVELFRKLASEL